MTTWWHTVCQGSLPVNEGTGFRIPITISLHYEWAMWIIQFWPFNVHSNCLAQYLLLTYHTLISHNTFSFTLIFSFTLTFSSLLYSLHSFILVLTHVLTLGLTLISHNISHFSHNPILTPLHNITSITFPSYLGRL